MYVTFKREGEESTKIMHCFYNDTKKQSDMMHNQDIKKQVLTWLETNSGNPPKFSSRLTIEEFISDFEAHRRNIVFE